MRSYLFVLLAVVGVTAPAHAIPIAWDMQVTVSRTNLPALDIAVGSEFSISMTLDSETPAIPTFFSNGYVYRNVFDAFTLSVNGHTLTLGPQSADPEVIPSTNSLGTVDWPDYRQVQWNTLLYEGDTPYYTETRFEFTDLDAFPAGSLPLTPPSLASARLNPFVMQFALYSPVPNNGGYLFIGGGQVDSLTAHSVPEPASGLLMLGGLGLMALARRRRTGRA